MASNILAALNADYDGDMVSTTQETILHQRYTAKTPKGKHRKRKHRVYCATLHHWRKKPTAISVRLVGQPSPVHLPLVYVFADRGPSR